MSGFARRVLLVGLVFLACGVGGVEADRYRKVVARRPACAMQVTNRTPFRVQVYIDGVYWGWVSPHNVFTFTGIAAGPTVLYGTTQYSEYSWGPQTLQCRGTSTWLLSF